MMLMMIKEKVMMNMTMLAVHKVCNYDDKDVDDVM
jgi:hypothetical protein